MRLAIIIPVTMNCNQIIRETQDYLYPMLDPETQLEFMTLKKGFPSVESELQGTFNATGVILNAFQAQADGCAGIFVDCFDDPGVYACREALDIPVFGAWLPAVLTAMSLAERVGIITTDREGILNEERKVRMAGFEKRVVAVGQVNLGVADIIEHPDELVRRLADKCTELWDKERIGAVCLGCTAMAPIIYKLQDKLRELKCPISVVEPLMAGVTYLEHTAHLRYSNALHSGITLDELTWE